MCACKNQALLTRMHFFVCPHPKALVIAVGFGEILRHHVEFFLGKTRIFARFTSRKKFFTIGLKCREKFWDFRRAIEPQSEKIFIFYCIFSIWRNSGFLSIIKCCEFKKMDHTIRKEFWFFQAAISNYFVLFSKKIFYFEEFESVYKSLSKNFVSNLWFVKLNLIQLYKRSIYSINFSTSHSQHN